MEYSRPFEESASLVAAVRLDTDVSGFIPNLAGPGMNKKKASEILIQVGDEQFNFINSLPYEVQNELHDSFLPNRKFTLRAFIVQNFIQSRSVYELRKYRTDNLFATHLRDITGRNYFQMLEGINKQLPFIHKNVKKDSPFYNGRPIQYIPYFNGRGELIDLEHVMVMLNLGNLEIEKPELIRSGEFDENNPGHWTYVRHVIRAITPDRLLRENQRPISLSRFDALDLMSVQGKIGQPILQALAKWISENNEFTDLIKFPDLVETQIRLFFKQIKEGVMTLKSPDQLQNEGESETETEAHFKNIPPTKF